MAFTTVAPIAQRVGVNDIQVSGSKIPVGATKVTIRALMSVPTRNNTNFSMDFDVYKRTLESDEWQHDTGGHWIGGSGFVSKTGVTNPPPEIVGQGQSLDNIRNKFILFKLNIPVQMPVGVEVEII